MLQFFVDKLFRSTGIPCVALGNGLTVKHLVQHGTSSQVFPFVQYANFKVISSFMVTTQSTIIRVA